MAKARCIEITAVAADCPAGARVAEKIQIMSQKAGPMADAIALIEDIFFLAKVRETAKLVGVTLETVTSGDQLAAAAIANPTALLLIDLNARQGALDAIERLGGSNGKQERGPGNPRRMIAFLSHVQTDLAERARAAGCERVMPRSQFAQDLPAILRGAKT